MREINYYEKIMYRKKCIGLILFKVIKSYLLFVLSVFTMGLGISLVTLAFLGTTPITSPSFTLSLYVPLSFGMLTMLMNYLFVILQILILGKDFPKEQYIQLVVGPILGIAIDFWSYFVIMVSQPNYGIKVIMVLLGCAIIAYSTILQLKANVVNNPAEGIVKAITIKTKKEFGTIKTYFDVSLVLSAIIISLIAFGNIQGVREGTIISAIIIGPLIKLFQKWT